MHVEWFYGKYWTKWYRHKLNHRIKLNLSYNKVTEKSSVTKFGNRCENRNVAHTNPHQTWENYYVYEHMVDVIFATTQKIGK